ncbi:Putative Eukaryotic aspartyl protease [[Torrubiella] hemipterigena]|uniref:Putative Eukaryotic aspartyl protease n=1 Tax=[Torrubiella] hemipterigena TaxID=1531966 RepID=A0A0A1SIQ1_9HYPO|nr:Putative Eukaryotic aspartyl protease [[Torrubiella] hemipterigena]
MLANTLTSVLLLASLASASPAAIEKRSFKVERFANEKFTGNNGPQALAKAFRKFGMQMPEGLEAAVTNEKIARRRNKPDFLPLGLLTGLADGLGGNAGGADAGQQNGQGHRKAKGKNNGKAKGKGKGKGKGNKNQNGGAGNGTASATNQTGKVDAVPEQNDKEFLAQVKIGGQPVTLDFDTGSSDLWVFNTQLNAQVTNGHSVYDPTASKTFQALNGAKFSISYGDGSGAAGNVGLDVVDVGGAVFDQQAIELATDVSQTFVRDQNNDGLMGLAFSSINTVKPQKQKTFFDNVMPSLAEPVFTADLRKGAAGAYEFGKIDTTKFQGDMTWVPINNKKGFWQFSSESFAVDGGQQQAGAQGGQAIADTGTTLLLADPTIVQGYYSKVQGAQNDKQSGGVTVPCDAQLPDLDLDIGGQYMARIKGSDLNFAPVSNGRCFGGLQATQAGGLGVYGDILFKSQFVAFNGANNSIGLAPHA